MISATQAAPMLNAARLYIIRGSNPPVCGREIERQGQQVTLNIAPVDWPFPRIKTFERAELVYAGGPREDYSEH